MTNQENSSRTKHLPWMHRKKLDFIENSSSFYFVWVLDLDLVVKTEGIFSADDFWWKHAQLFPANLVIVITHLLAWLLLVSTRWEPWMNREASALFKHLSCFFHVKQWNLSLIKCLTKIIFSSNMVVAITFSDIAITFSVCVCVVCGGGRGREGLM